MSDSERITAYSEAVKNFELIHDLPPKNSSIDQFTAEQKKKFDHLCSKDSFLVPVVYKNQISHFKINKKILKNSLSISHAKNIYRNLYLRNTHTKYEQASFIIINLTMLMLCILLSNSKEILLLVKDEYLLNVIAFSSYLSLTLVLLVYYLAVSFIVFSFDVINDITLGIIEKHPNLIGTEA